jgi:hypothetical protein
MLQFLVMAYKNTKVVGGRDLADDSFYYVCCDQAKF